MFDRSRAERILSNAWLTRARRPYLNIGAATDYRPVFGSNGFFVGSDIWACSSVG